MVEFKVRLWLDYAVYGAPDAPYRHDLEQGIIDDFATLMGDPPAANASAPPPPRESLEERIRYRTTVSDVEPPREGQVALFVRLRCTPHYLRHLKRSPTALSRELRALLRRVDAGTLDLALEAGLSRQQGFWASKIDGSYMLSDQFLRCPIGTHGRDRGQWTWTYLEEADHLRLCEPIILPCDNGTIWKPCPPKSTTYAVVYAVWCVLLGIMLLAGVIAAYSAHADTNVEYLLLGAYGVFMQLQAPVNASWYTVQAGKGTAGMAVAATVLWVSLLGMMGLNALFGVYFHARYVPRHSKHFDGRFALWTRSFPKVYRNVMLAGLVHADVMRLPYTDLLNMDEFGAHPLVGRGGITRQIRLLGILHSLVVAVPQIYLSFWALQTSSKQGADTFLYVSILVGIGILARSIVAAGCRAASTGGLVLNVIREVRKSRFVAPAEAAPPPDVEQPHKRVTFVKNRPLGLPLSGTPDPQYPAVIRAPPTDQAAAQGLAVDDALWRINGSAVVPSTFKDVVRQLRMTERPFTADFRVVGKGAIPRRRRAPLPPVHVTAAGIEEVRSSHRRDMLLKEFDKAVVVRTNVEEGGIDDLDKLIQAADL